MSRMFKSITRTWNVFVGCRFNCTYCSARNLALTRLKDSPRYRWGFNPHLVVSELSKTFKPGEFIFVGYMGDISFALTGEINTILEKIKDNPETRFLLCTKNPNCFHRWDLELPENVIISTTLETNRDYLFGKAPQPIARFEALQSYDHPHKMVSIEPVMDFDLGILVPWITSLKPNIIEVGADNYHNNLPEPSPKKLEFLLSSLRKISPNVIEKDGLERLLRKEN